MSSSALSLLNPGVQRGILGVINWQADGSYTYLLNDMLPQVRSLGAGQSATELFAYTATDGQAKAQGELAITVQGMSRPSMVMLRASAMLMLRICMSVRTVKGVKGSASARHVACGSIQADTDR